MSNKFIRLDIKGTWRGTEHQSHFASYDETGDDKDLEDGISCYYANIEGIKKLWDYANNNMGLTNDSINNMQLTIFEGNWSGTGSDYEELAWCTKTIKEIEASEWFEKMYLAEEKQEGNYFNEDLDDYEEISEKEYEILITEATGLN